MIYQIRFAIFGSALLMSACGGGEKPANDATSVSDTPSADSTSDSPLAAPPHATASTTAPQDTTPKTAYDKDSVEIVLKRASRQVKDNCGGVTDDAGKVSGPWGKTTISVQLGHNGHTKGATLSAPFAGTKVGKCVENSFTNLIYPPFAGADTTIDWEVEVVKPDAKK